MHAKKNAPDSDSPAFIPAPQVWRRYDISDMTLHRWLRDPDMGFPQPVYLGRMRYFVLADLENWERSRVRASAARAAPARKTARPAEPAPAGAPVSDAPRRRGRPPKATRPEAAALAGDRL
jgi:predicted DNA-binding transcriptional regulator AlpA